MRSNNRVGLEEFYNAQKETFLKWAVSRFDCDHDTLIDVYQDAIVTLYHNISEGKLTEIETSIEAYLFGIARNLLLKRNQKDQKTQLVENVSSVISELDYSIYKRIDEDHQTQQLKSAFSKLKEKCREIIYLYYYHRFSLDSIASRLNYGNTDVVKSRKNQCMKELKKILEK